jgi:hypothetical protein
MPPPLLAAFLLFVCSRERFREGERVAPCDAQHLSLAAKRFGKRQLHPFFLRVEAPTHRLAPKKSLKDLIP